MTMRSGVTVTVSKAFISCSPTYLPFLYETKTLSSLQILRRSSLPIVPIIEPHLSFSRTFTSCPIRYYQSRENVGNATSTRRRAADADTKRSGVRRPINFDNIVSWRPTALTKSDDKREGKPQAGFSGRMLSRLGNEPDDINFSDQFAPNDVGISEEAALRNDIDFVGLSVDSEPRAGKSTITTTERNTFLRIFSDIHARSKATSQKGVIRHDLLHPEIAERREDAERKLVSIMDRAAKRSPPPVSDETMRDDKLKALESFPKVLRTAAARAMGLTDKYVADAEGQNDGEVLVEEEEEEEESVRAKFLNEQRASEYERIETKMRAAPTDFELWNTMEQEVFGLVKKLGLAEEKEVDKPPKTRRRKGKNEEVGGVAVSSSEVSASPSPSANADKEHMDLEIHGPLYPSFLLLGFRLLERSFAKPSPLVNNILPRIKSMGLMSHVLGASTALYNEQIRVMWHRNDDFLGVLDLLSEMEQVGLDFDDETLDIVTDIHRTQMRTRKGLNGDHLQILWTLPEFATGKFRDWRSKIQESLVIRAAEYSQR